MSEAIAAIEASIAETSRSTKLRKLNKLPIFIVEDHNHVVEFLLKLLQKRYLPFTNNTIIHFDSHPDLTIPKNLKISDYKDKNCLLDDLSIENWLIPLLYNRNFTKIYWLKPDWAEQIPDGNYSICLGENEENILSCDSELDYYLSDGSYLSKDKLKNCSEFQLIVKNLNYLMKNECDEEIDINGAEKYILDIDLDFFITKNPFLSIYPKANTYNRLKVIFSYNYYKEKCVSSEEFTKLRLKQLKFLETTFEYLNTNKSLQNCPFKKDLDSYFYLNELIDLIKDLIGNYQNDVIDWLIILNAGLTCDNICLPHNLTEKSEIIKLVEVSCCFLIKKLIHIPTAITISRSSSDDYCPAEIVDFVQEILLNNLYKIYNDQITCHLINYYKDTDDDWTI